MSACPSTQPDQTDQGFDDGDGGEYERGFSARAIYDYQASKLWKSMNQHCTCPCVPLYIFYCTVCVYLYALYYVCVPAHLVLCVCPCTPYTVQCVSQYTLYCTVCALVHLVLYSVCPSTPCTVCVYTLYCTVCAPVHLVLYSVCLCPCTYTSAGLLGGMSECTHQLARYVYLCEIEMSHSPSL